MSAHEDFSRIEGMRAGSDRSFGLVVGGFLLIVGLTPLLKVQAPRWWALGSGAALLIAAGVRPSLLHPAHLLWIRLGYLLNRVVSPIVTGLLFFLVFTPMGLLLRLVGKDPLRLRFDRGAASYWIKREPPGPSPDSMRNQF